MGWGMKDFFANSLLAVFSVLVTFLVLELGTRALRGEWDLDNFLELKMDLFRGAYPSEFDQDLGWSLKPGVHPKNLWDKTVTVLEDQTRSNGAERELDKGSIILAVGDSFTFGDQVDDHQSWPAHLEDMTGNTVINGGVFGYGVDQAYIRMILLAEKYHPSALVLSFIPDDINRSQLSYRTAVPKPYFDIDASGNLVLVSDHVVPPSRPRQLDPFRNALGYSLLAYRLLKSVAPVWWLQGGDKSIQVHEKGPEVVCKLFDKMGAYAKQKGIDAYIMVQYEMKKLNEDKDVVSQVLGCVDTDVITIVDLREPLVEVAENDLDELESLFVGHMSSKGNRFVASELKKEMLGQ